MQLITRVVYSHTAYYFFSKIRGMSGEFVFPEDEIIPVSGCSVQKHKVILSNSETSVFTFGQGNRCIVTVLNAKTQSVYGNTILPRDVNFPV